MGVGFHQYGPPLLNFTKLVAPFPGEDGGGDSVVPGLERVNGGMIRQRRIRT
jgi:hypothetical protein